MVKIRFLHAADLHLDSPFKGLEHLPAEIFQKVRKSTFQSLTRLVDVAIDQKVDFVLLAGDLFDMEQRSLFAQAKLRNEFLRLQKQHIPVYVIHGNHDFIDQRSQSFHYPDNVHIFADTVGCLPFIKNGEHLANLYGFSYNKRHFTENMSVNYIKQDHHVPFHIGLLHGNLSGRDGHDPYAPFTLPDLLDKDFHYWALGHIHKREVLHQHPPIVYPGNIQGRHKKETGLKGVYLAEMHEGKKTELQFIPTSSINWESFQLSIDEHMTLDELLESMKNTVEGVRGENRGALLSFEFIGNGELHHVLQDPHQLDDLLVLLNEGEERKDNFIFVYSIKLSTMISYSKEELREKTFYQDLFAITEQTNSLQEIVRPLFKHGEARKFLDTFSEEEEKEIIAEAENWLVTKFLEHEKG
ncbi:putative metallophosphoesterase YhaO [Bacillus sp. THAF10]|uniref:metallophosphoesterase family protein n=1 Tax=Bacillus sp. THAF10 TaxID=2587848 RepID=UPI00126894D4|nr:DNA repair exonuclease [Bacillus sp. THAF10]QFT88253.1 putative metallophosphoesterase YhaO [Bacillus sp. THAF10]